MHCSEPAWSVQVMKTDCLFASVAIVKANADNNIITDVHELADQMLAIYATVDRDELIRVIQEAIITVGGTAL